MAKVYEYEPSEHFEHLLFKENSFEGVFKKFRDTVAMGQTWQPFEIVINHELPGPIADFPMLIGGPPVFSQHAWEVLESLIGFEAEALPIIHPRGPHLAIHVLSLIEALDRDKSKISLTASGDIFDVDRHVWKQEIIKGHHIFKIPETAGIRVYVSEEFRQIVEANGLRGLEFRDRR